MGSWSQSCGPSNTWECLSVWRDEQTPQSAWGFEHFDGVDAQLFDDEHCTHANLMYGAHQGLQPYVNVWDYHDTPFTHELMGNFTIDMGMGQDFTGLFLPRAGMSHDAGASCEETIERDAIASLSPKAEEISARHEYDDNVRAKRGQEGIGAPPMQSTEQLGKPRLASCGTLTPSPGLRDEGNSPSPGLVQCAFLGGGKDEQDDYYILEDEEMQMEASLTPGLLQDRLLVLQAKAMEAIQALPAHCREDQAFGLVETRVWGLEALKHILRMRLALQGSVQLTRPVTEFQEMPPNNELLAANLTLTIRNTGNRCFANSVLRIWCWMGAHHERPREFWGPSTNLCLQILQQDDIPDIFWASELQTVLARLENPQAQHDASEFMVLLWEHWGQTGMQGNWHSYF